MITLWARVLVLDSHGFLELLVANVFTPCRFMSKDTTMGVVQKFKHLIVDFAGLHQPRDSTFLTTAHGTDL